MFPHLAPLTYFRSSFSFLHQISSCNFTQHLVMWRRLGNVPVMANRAMTTRFQNPVLLEEMKSVAIKPFATTFSTLSPGLCDADKISESHRVPKDMAANQIPPKDSSILMKLMSGQYEVGNLDAVKNLGQTMEKGGVTDRVSFSSTNQEGNTKQADILKVSDSKKGQGGSPFKPRHGFILTSSVFLPNLALFWHINQGMEEILKDYVHHDMTRTFILINLRLFLIIGAKDVFLSLI